MCPIAHVPHWPCAPLLMCQKDVKLSKRCQMSKSQTHRLWRRFTKKINWHNEVHTYWRQFWRQIWRSPKLFKNTFYVHFEGFWWPSYVMSKIDVNMCEPHYVNLFFLWTSFIVYVFDFLTFDIFLIIWHLFDNLTSFWHFDFSFNLNHLSPSQGYFLLNNGHVMCIWFTQYAHYVGWWITLYDKSTLWWFALFQDLCDRISEYSL